jgi:hypothetical protein
MNPFRRPQLWVRLLSVAALLFALWLLLTPRTVLYYVDDQGNPEEVYSVYSWSAGRDQMMMLDKNMFERGGTPDFATSVRLGCGTALTEGENEGKRDKHGPEACSQIETPRLLIGMGAAVLGVVGFPFAARLSRRQAAADPFNEDGRSAA